MPRTPASSAPPPPAKPRAAKTAADAPDTFGRELANWMFPAYLLMLGVSILLIHRLGTPVGTRNSVHALFTAVNAGTLTGFRESVGLGGLNAFGEVIVAALITLGSLFSMILSGLAVKRIAKLQLSDTAICLGAIGVQLAATVFGSILLADFDRTWPQTIFLAISSFSNCGVTLGGLPGPTDISTYAVILPLTLLGGIGLPAILELGRLILFHKPVSPSTRAAVGLTAWAYLLGLILLTCLRLWQLGSVDPATLRSVLANSSVLTVQSRTGGLPIVPISTASPAGSWVLMLLMLLGGCSAGTAGGLKLNTLAELIRGARRLLSGQSPGKPLGAALSWLGIYLFALLGAAILLTRLNDGSTALFDAISALSNCGLNQSEIPDDRQLLFAYCAIMLVGRMLPWMILWWMVESNIESDLPIG